MIVAVLGKNGLLGSDLVSLLSGIQGIELLAFDREEIDITDSDSLRDFFENRSPDFIFNAAAYTNVDDCERNHDLALRVNAAAPASIAEFCNKNNARLVHFSTDYVFDGQNESGYRENDVPSPINAYGLSKLKGEQFIQNQMTDYYIVRTSWLFGKNGKNFVDTMLVLGTSKNELKVVDDQIGCPTYSLDLAQAVISNFLLPYVNDKTPLDYGVFHLTNSNKTSWYGLAKKIFEIKKMNVKVIPVSSDEFPRPAKRPHFSVLLNTKIQTMPDWEDALNRYLNLDI